MKTQKLQSLIGTAAAVCTLCVTAQQATAGTLYGDWNYGIDATKDGSGGSVYDINGMAVKETTDSIFVAFTGGMSLAGHADSRARGGSVGWGDVFFNFTGKDFQTANNTSELFGIRFAANNDSTVATGVYKNVKATSVALVNEGYSSLQHYYNNGWEKPNTEGTDMSTKEAAYAYFSPANHSAPILNVIGSGTKVGDLKFLNTSELKLAGLNFGHFSASGPETIGFQFSKSLLPGGSYISNVFLECGNDGVALAGKLKSVPESSTLAGLAVFGLAFLKVKGKRRQQLT